MRSDENGHKCPATLGEYLDIVSALAPDSRAVEFLEERIRDAVLERDEVVEVTDFKMRAILAPMMLQPRRFPR